MTQFWIDRRTLLQATGAGIIGSVGSQSARSSEVNSTSVSDSPRVLFEDDFENHSTGDVPSYFVTAGNRSQGASRERAAVGTQSYRMRGTHGGCMRAITRTSVDTTREMRISGYYYLGEGGNGCHDGGSISFRTETSSGTYPGESIDILYFNNDFTMTIDGEVIAEFERHEWVQFEIEYIHNKADSYVQYNYIINNNTSGTISRDAHSYETDIEALTLQSDDATVFWDELNVIDIRSSGSGLDISSDDVEIRFVNKFRTESTNSFLESLYAEVQQGLPVSDPSVPDANEAYIHVDLRVEVPDGVADSITEIEPRFSNDKTEQTFAPSDLSADIPGQRTTLAELAPGEYGWDNLRMRTETQVGIETLETVAMLWGIFSVGELESPVHANTEAYPDMYLTELIIEGDGGETVTLDVDERIPRVDDVCTSVGFSQVMNEDCPVDDPFSPYGGNVRVFSPATIAIEDPEGRITGQVREDGSIVEYDEIPGALYSGSIRREFLLFPDGEYQMIIDGIDEGTATIEIDELDGNEITTTTYKNVDVDSETRLSWESGTNVMTVDIGRDGNTDTELTPSDTVERTTEAYFNDQVETAGDDSSPGTEDGGPDDGGLIFGLSTAQAGIGGAIVGTVGAVLAYTGIQAYRNERDEDGNRQPIHHSQSDSGRSRKEHQKRRRGRGQQRRGERMHHSQHEPDESTTRSRKQSNQPPMKQSSQDFESRPDSEAESQRRDRDHIGSQNKSTKRCPNCRRPVEQGDNVCGFCEETI